MLFIASLSVNYLVMRSRQQTLLLLSYRGIVVLPCLLGGSGNPVNGDGGLGNSGNPWAGREIDILVRVLVLVNG